MRLKWYPPLNPRRRTLHDGSKIKAGSPVLIILPSGSLTASSRNNNPLCPGAGSVCILCSSRTARQVFSSVSERVDPAGSANDIIFPISENSLRRIGVTKD